MLSEQEKEWMKEFALEQTADPTYIGLNGYVERVFMPNFIDMHNGGHGQFVHALNNKLISQ
jgi:hypothetical protein